MGFKSKNKDVFERHEIKYMLTLEQKNNIIEAIKPYMSLDKYKRTTIRNIYFDTDSYLLIRRSIEKPVYKEKLRIRSYEQARSNSMVFVELKKKYKSIVYKRRLSLPEAEAIEWLSGGKHCRERTQITDEVDYFVSYYGSLNPVVFLSYEREAFFCKNGSDFRVTFDENILCREEELSLEADVWGIPLLEDGKALMEIKCSGAMPLWMTHVLSKEGLFKTSFSKYGTAYRTMILPKLKEECVND